MKKTIKQQHVQAGASVLEYVILIMGIILALVAMQPYLRNAFVGQYHKAGSGLGFGRQYDPKDTRVCIRDASGVWYSRTCFENRMESVGTGDLTALKNSCSAPCAGM